MRWAIVLAGGRGRRVQALCRDRTGRPAPKQFCALGGDRTLLERTLDRAAGVVDPKRIVVVVAPDHHSWWAPILAPLPEENVVVQPHDRGTAAGVLLPVLRVLDRDPAAELLVLPSDHAVDDEDALRGSLEESLQASKPGRAVLVGFAPESADGEYGWIVPASGELRVKRVARFVEKPPRDVAEALLAAGGLWNAFLLAARGDAIVRLVARSQPGLLHSVRRGLRDGRLGAEYEAMPSRDFSRDVLERVTERLDVIAGSPCGWTDLGTPARLLRWLDEGAVVA